jgi:hypothetical protein
MLKSLSIKQTDSTDQAQPLYFRSLEHLRSLNAPHFDNAHSANDSLYGDSDPQENVTKTHASVFGPNLTTIKLVNDDCTVRPKPQMFKNFPHSLFKSLSQDSVKEQNQQI